MPVVLLRAMGMRHPGLLLHMDESFKQASSLYHTCLRSQGVDVNVTLIQTKRTGLPISELKASQNSTL